jgi:hypothetical protein
MASGQGGQRQTATDTETESEAWQATRTHRQISWNRKASAQSCAGTLPSGQQGTFQVVAQADGHASPVRSFQMLR